MSAPRAALEACFGDRALDAVPLTGGLTNANYLVTCADGRYVMRVFGEDSAQLTIARDDEWANSRRAAAAGVGAPAVAFRPQARAMVFGFVEGQTMSAAQVASGQHVAAIADACRRLHSAEPFTPRFDMFAVMDRYRRVVDSAGHRLPAGYDELAPQVAAVREALARRPEALVSCHNDLLAENLLLGADGSVTLIDYEYSGANEASFELGNLAAESGLSDARLAALVAEYWALPPGTTSDARHARALLWGAMARYGWTLWASIQDGVSPLDFDFWAWGMQKYDAAAAFLGDDRLRDLLAAV